MLRSNDKSTNGSVGTHRPKPAIDAPRVMLESLSARRANPGLTARLHVVAGLSTELNPQSLGDFSDSLSDACRSTMKVQHPSPINIAHARIRQQRVADEALEKLFPIALSQSLGITESKHSGCQKSLPSRCDAVV